MQSTVRFANVADTASASWQIIESIPMGVNATPVNITTYLN